MGDGPMEKTMKMKVLGAASIAALVLVACAKKEDTTVLAETPAVEDMATADSAEIAAADATDYGAEEADVYAAPAAVDLNSVRTKDALAAAADAAFAQADSDADGSLSQTEFYSLATMMAPAADAMFDDAVDAGAGMAADAAGDIADAPIGDAPIDGVVAEEPMTDATALDASYATIAGADASLTTEDLRAAFLSRFDAADANLDGSLDDAEAESFKAAKLF